MFSSPFFASILGKRKEESESEVSSGEESEDEVEQMEEEKVAIEEEEDEEDEDVQTEDNSNVPGAVFDPSTATLSQLLTKIIPDAKIHCPNVIIVGAQSSGKTKMIISMVFHHLIENPSVTDEMGEKLLKIFRTGEKMVTRRPTKIEFVKTEPGSPCNITLTLEGASAEFGDQRFSEIIDSVHLESMTRDGKAFGKELIVTIAAPDLPSMTFTDLPGLITDDRAVSDEEGMSIRKLVKKYMRKLNTTLVVVEPASTEDFETSQVAPLLKEMRDTDRPHIFNNSVLVLSKCDKIRQGLEGRIMSIMDLSSPSIADYPFKHVVGVVNKVESSARTPTSVGETQSFAEFKQTFRATKQHEKEIFSSYLNLDGSACDRKTQCTTAAVFHQMDRITFHQVHNSIGHGLEVIHEKVEKLEQQMRDELAPPLSYYDTLLQDADGRSVVDKSNRKEILKALREALKKVLAYELKELKIYDRHPYDLQRIAAGQAAFLDSVGIKWPEEYGVGDMFVSQRQSAAVDDMRRFFGRFISRPVRSAVLNTIDNDNVGCFAGIHSRFHRIDRFGLLVDALIDELRNMLPACEQSAKEAVNAYLVHFYDFEVPKGVSKERFGRLLDELHHISVRRVFESVRASSKGAHLEELFNKDVLFEENPEFVALRNELHARWERLRQQKWILARCKQVSSNEQLRDTLQEAYEEQRTRLPARDEHNWQEFWKEAELLEKRNARTHRVRAPPTSMYSRSTSSEVPVVSSTQPSQQDLEQYSQIETWPEQLSLHGSQVSAPMEVASPSVRSAQQHNISNSQSSHEATRLREDAREEMVDEEMPALHQSEPAAESVPVVEPEAPARQHSRDNVTPFKRMKQTHDELATSSTTPSNTHPNNNSDWMSYNAGSPTFVTGSLFNGAVGSPSARATAAPQAGSTFLGRGGSASGNSLGSSNAGVGMLNQVKNFVSSWSSPAVEPLAAPKMFRSATNAGTSLYRPNYSAAAATSTNVPMTSPGTHSSHAPQQFGNQYASTTPNVGFAGVGIVKREVEYSTSAHASREAKGSPDDMIDLTD